MLQSHWIINYKVLGKMCKELGIKYTFPLSVLSECPPSLGDQEDTVHWAFQETQMLKKRRALKAAAVSPETKTEEGGPKTS